MRLGIVIAIVLAVGAFNEYVNRAKWTRAQSIFQAIGVFVLAIPGIGPWLDKVPVSRWVIRRMANLPGEDGLQLPRPPTTAWLPLLFVLVLSACGGLKPYYVALDVAERSVVSAANVFPSFDQAKRTQIVKDAKDKEGGQKALDDWERTSIRVFAAISGTDSAVKLAKDGLVDVANGVRSKADLTGWIGPVLNAARNLAGLLRSVGVNVPEVK